MEELSKLKSSMRALRDEVGKQVESCSVALSATGAATPSAPEPSSALVVGREKIEQMSSEVKDTNPDRQVTSDRGAGAMHSILLSQFCVRTYSDLCSPN